MSRCRGGTVDDMVDARPTRILQTREVPAYVDPSNPWIAVYFDEVQFPNGIAGRYNRIVECSGRSGVAVLPMLSDSILLVEVDRYPTGTRMWEIPRGFGESDDPVDDAARELLEETGWRATALVSLGRVHGNSGLLAGAVELFLAVIDQRLGREGEGTDDTEVATVSTFSLDQVQAMAASGEITDAFTLAALYRAEHRGHFDHRGPSPTPGTADQHSGEIPSPGEDRDD